MFVLLGITDEVTTCECCGKADLRCTMALENPEDPGVVYYGRDCGARALGWRVSATRAESIAKGTARMDYEALYRIAAGHVTGEIGGTGEIDGVSIRAYRTFGRRDRDRLLSEGWHRGPADLVWRLA